jgi:hypothetical protein
VIDPTPLESLERHLTFAGVMTMWSSMVGLGIWLLNKHKIWLNIKNRLNDLWWDRCAGRQERYTPLENGAPAVIPPPGPKPLYHEHGD